MRNVEGVNAVDDFLAWMACTYRMVPGAFKGSIDQPRIGHQAKAVALIETTSVAIGSNFQTCPFLCREDGLRSSTDLRCRTFKT
jgi:hypothetical protein